MAEASAVEADRVLHAAQARGLLPADATLPEQDARPWPVVLLTALGAWLAAIPLIAVIGMLLGDFVTRGIGAYGIGILLLAGAVVVLRSRGLPVFVEQLAVPALLVGGGALAAGLQRDASDRTAAALLCAVALGLAAAIPRAWLRTLLGALAGFLAMVALSPGRVPMFHRGAGMWFPLHLVLFAGLLALFLQQTPRRWSAALEPTAVGWLAAALAGLAWWSGMTFLAGGAVAPGFGGEMAQHLFGRGIGDLFTDAASLLSALLGALLLARAWPTLRRPAALLAGVVLAALAGFLPALGGALLTLAAAALTRRWRLAALAALTAVWIVGSFYYQLALPLATKALVLVLAGALLAALAWLARQPADRVARETLPPPERRPALWIGGAALATLLFANGAIWQKEDLIASGEKVFVALAPIDPRSLMQGDFMRLEYRLPAGVEALASVGAGRPHVIARRDARGIAQLLRVARDGETLAPGEFRIELTPKAGRWTLASDAWFFREGDAARWQEARFAEFRVDAGGRALLVGMADAQLRPIPIAP